MPNYASANSIKTLASQNWWRAAIAAWTLAVVGTFAWITRHDFSTPAVEPTFAAEQWPEATALAPSPDRPSLLLFMHPKCPCTRATIRELGRVLDALTVCASLQPQLLVVVSLPLGAGVDWSESGTVRQALSLPRATAVMDFDGLEATRFGVTGSGAVLLYSTRGERLFAGGITMSRGHEGGNVGATQLRERLINPATASAASFPVFGCQLCLPVAESTTDADQPALLSNRPFSADHRP